MVLTRSFWKPIPALAAVFACAEPQQAPGGLVTPQVIEVSLPRTGVMVGYDRAPVTLVEFGSHMCPLCRAFGVSRFPDIQTAFINPARVRYRYVDLSPAGIPTRFHALIECLGRSGQFAEARRWAYGADTVAANFDSLLVMAVGFGDWTAGAVTGCVDGVRRSDRLTAERRAARSLGVRATPTFVLGQLSPSGELVGWAFEGVEFLDSLPILVVRVEALLRAD